MSMFRASARGVLIGDPADEDTSAYAHTPWLTPWGGGGNGDQTCHPWFSIVATRLATS